MEWQQGTERSEERKLSEVQQSNEEQSMWMKKVSASSFNETPGKEVLQQGREAEAPSRSRFFMLREDDALQKERWRLSKLKGMDWPNIAHVPYIRINRNIIQNLYS
jgi:hypothetical protein